MSGGVDDGFSWGLPHPGSAEARAMKCRCPVIDNHYGDGCGLRDEHGRALYYIAEGCPLHWRGLVQRQQPEPTA